MKSRDPPGASCEDYWDDTVIFTAILDILRPGSLPWGLLRVSASHQTPHFGGYLLFAGTVLGMGIPGLWRVQRGSALGVLQRYGYGGLRLGIDRRQMAATGVCCLLGLLGENSGDNQRIY